MSKVLVLHPVGVHGGVYTINGRHVGPGKLKILPEEDITDNTKQITEEESKHLTGAQNRAIATVKAEQEERDRETGVAELSDDADDEDADEDDDDDTDAETGETTIAVSRGVTKAKPAKKVAAPVTKNEELDEEEI